MFAFTFSRAHLDVSRHVHSAKNFACLLIVTTIVAPRADQIGVTGALRCAVIRTASLQTDTPIGLMSSGQEVFLGDDIKVGTQDPPKGHAIGLNRVYARVQLGHADRRNCL